MPDHAARTIVTIKAAQANPRRHCYHTDGEYTVDLTPPGVIDPPVIVYLHGTADDIEELAGRLFRQAHDLRVHGRLEREVSA